MYILLQVISSMSVAVAGCMAMLLIAFGPYSQTRPIRRLLGEFFSALAMFIALLAIATVFWQKKAYTYDDYFSVACMDKSLLVGEPPATLAALPGLCSRSKVLVAFSYIACLGWAVVGAAVLLKRRQFLLELGS